MDSDALMPLREGSPYSSGGRKTDKTLDKQVKTVRAKRRKKTDYNKTLTRLASRLDQLVSRLELDEPEQPVLEADVKLLGALIKNFEQISALQAKEQGGGADDGEALSADDLRRELASRLERLSKGRKT